MAVRRTLVCFGDSLTQGTIGASYVERLRAALPEARVVNAGVNGDTVLNLLRRVERDVVALRPDAVTILIGLNDLGTAYGELALRCYYGLGKHVWVRLTPARFGRAYRHLLAVLRRRTSARVALCTLTTLGEDPADPAQALVDAYAAVVRALAVQEGLPLIDLRAAFLAAMRADPRPGPPYRIWTPLRDWGAIALRGASYPTLGARRGYRLLCDGAHLGAAGADLVVATMLPTVRKLLAAPSSGQFDSQPGDLYTSAAQEGGLVNDGPGAAAGFRPPLH